MRSDRIASAGGLQATLVGIAALACSAALAHAQPATLFENARVFDSANAVLTEPQNVLVTGNTIAAVSPDPITPEAGLEVTTIAGDGRVLTTPAICLEAARDTAARPLSRTDPADRPDVR